MRTALRSARDGGDLLRAIEHARSAISKVGPHRIEVVTMTCNRICLQPSHLADGEAIARSLGLDQPMDLRMFVPGHTLWRGEHDDLEVQVRSVLREVMAR